MSKSATDELRALLDARGVEWGNIRNDGSESDYLTEWQFDGIEGHAIATEWAVGNLTVCIAHPMTPVQAIAATLGSSNCTNSERMTEQNGPERSGEYVTVWMDHEPTKLHWGVPVVRCRDCKYYRDHEWMMVTDVVDVCHFFSDGVKVEPDGFCAWGERKEEQ